MAIPPISKNGLRMGARQAVKDSLADRIATLPQVYSYFNAKGAYTGHRRTELQKRIDISTEKNVLQRLSVRLKPS